MGLTHYERISIRLAILAQYWSITDKQLATKQSLVCIAHCTAKWDKNTQLSINIHSKQPRS